MSGQTDVYKQQVDRCSGMACWISREEEIVVDDKGRAFTGFGERCSGGQAPRTGHMARRVLWRTSGSVSSAEKTPFVRTHFVPLLT